MENKTNKKVELYCKNPKCFTQFLVKHKITAMKEWQLSDYAWSESEEKMLKEFIKKLKEELKHEYDPLIFEKKLNKLAGDKLTSVCREDKNK